MKSLLSVLICFISFLSFSQETEVTEEFLPINLEGKDAFLSTKTGEYIFLEHAETDPTKLETTRNGVIYTDIKMHTVAKKETISKIAKEYNISKEEILKQNKLTDSKLSIGQQIKIIKKIVVNSSSPVISQDGESKIIAKLQPGQTPAGLESKPFVAPSSPTTTTAVNETKAIVNTEVVEKVEEKIEEAKVEVVEKTIEVTKQKEEVTTDSKEVLQQVVADEIEETETVVEEAETIEDSAETSNSIYIVKAGETLFRIAKKNNISVQTLKELNNLNSNSLDIGQKLKLK